MTTFLAAALAWSLAVPLIGIVRGGERLTIVPNLQVDAARYDAIARDLANRRAIDAIPPLQPPGFVAFLAIIYFVAGHSLIAAKVALWGCLVVAAALAARLARRLHENAAAGWAAAILTASSPALQGYTGTIQYEVLAAALVLVLITASLQVSNGNGRAASMGRAAAAGVAAGVSVLTREVLIALVPLLVVVVWRGVAHRAGSRAGAAAGGVLALCALCVVGGWSALQSVRAGRLVPITDKASVLWLQGHNPFANGTWNVPLAGVGEPAGLAFVLAHPKRELWLTGRRFGYFWGVLRDGWNVPRPSAVWIARASAGRLPLDIVLPATRGGWLLALVVIGCALLRNSQWREWWLLPATVCAIMAVHLATLASYRFAVPILPVVFVLVSGLIARLVSVLARPQALIMAMVILVISAAMQGAHWPVTYRVAASEMDGLRAENRIDPDGRVVRFADAARGRRPVMILNDEYLPGGPFVIRLRIRRHGGVVPRGTRLARVSVRPLGKGVVCEASPTIEQIATADTWTLVSFPCMLTRDGLASLAVETFGAVDVAFSDVELRWRVPRTGEKP